MRNILRRAVILVMTWLLFILWAPLTVYAEEETKTVKVGYYEDGDYMSQNQRGEYVGFNIEFLQELAKQTNIEFEFIDAVSWNAAFDMLVKGDIDLLPAVYFTEERDKEMLFVTLPMCNIYTTLNVRMDDERYDYEDFAAFEGMRVGIIRGGVDGENFKEFCGEHGVSLEIIEYDETEELLTALENSEVDGVAITHLGKNSSFRSVAQFAPSPIYFAVAKSQPDLLAELNRAMNSILLSNPGYETDLYDKYLAPSSNQKPVFTKEERQYIQEGTPVVVSYDPEFAPLSYQDEKTGEFRGVSADVFEFIAANSGLIFRYEAHSQAEALELLRQGAIDALCLSDGDYLWDGRNNIKSTLYYLSAPTTMITQYGTDKPVILALSSGYQLSETIEKDNPDREVRYYRSAEECLEAVRGGEADATYINTPVAGLLTNEEYYSGMNEAMLGRYISKMRVGVSSAADLRLFSIMNKCIQYLPEEQVDSYLMLNSVAAKEVSFSEFVGQHIWLFIPGIALFLGIIIVFVSLGLRNALHSNRRIQNLLYKDDLTGLDNINGFYKKWPAAAAEERRPAMALLYSDICQFKLINDNFGFAMGDKVLCACSQALKAELDEKEECVRVSADNFVMLMRYDSWDRIVERLKSAVERLDAWRRINTEIPYRIDLVSGVYFIDRTDTSDIKHMMDLANYARRYAKDTPGSFAVLYDEEMRRQALLAQQLESSLESALSGNEFEVYYQPKVSVADGRIVGSEALIRWNHPQKGFLTPGTFVPLFEKNGMIKKVDFWLFDNVCRSMREWEEQGREVLPVSCNFSRLHFDQKDFPERVCETADHWGIPHHLLEIEITESALMEEPGAIKAMLVRLKAKGFQIAIDDFGSGYSSLGQLQQMPADVLKLDRSFVCSGVTGRREQIVVESIIHMAEELGMSVICEGVESETQLEVLKKMNCQFIQGFYFYRPMRRGEFEKLMG